MGDREYVSWQQIEDYIENLAQFISRNYPELNKGVYAIPKGGLVLGVMLAHRLDLPLLAAPCEGCIVIDDIADTGITLKHYQHCDYFITTMFYHKQSEVVPVYWYKEKKEEWVVYPWEVSRCTL